MNLIPKDAIDAKQALRALPPIIKGYLRAGCLIGEGAVIDHQFGTTDVFIYLPVKDMDPRYMSRFGAGGLGRFFFSSRSRPRSARRCRRRRSV